MKQTIGAAIINITAGAGLIAGVVPAAADTPENTANTIVYAHEDPEILAACPQIGHTDYAIIPVSGLPNFEVEVLLRGSFLSAEEATPEYINGINHVIQQIDDAAASNEEKPIFVRVNSTGGALFSAGPMYTALNNAQLTQQVVTLNEAEALSWGATIAFNASDNLSLMNDGAVYLTHPTTMAAFTKDGEEQFTDLEGIDNPEFTAVGENFVTALDLAFFRNLNTGNIVSETNASAVCADSLVTSGKDVVINTNVALALGFADAAIIRDDAGEPIAMKVSTSNPRYVDSVLGLGRNKISLD